MSFRVAVLLMLSLLSGCAWPGLAGWHGAGLPTAAPIENPMLLPVNDREFVWAQIVDTIDDYFKIQREQRVHIVGDILTEGFIETVPTTGATYLEPWRRDSTPGFERLHSTLQSIRRHAIVRVIPTEAGYLVEVVVYKELEDLQRPENATVGASTLRHDGSLVRREVDEEVADQPVTVGWIRLGRDVSLEQQILAEMRARLTGL